MEIRSVLPATWGVPDEFRRRLGDRVGRQRAMQADGHLLLVLHKSPQSGDNQREGRYFWRKPDGTWTTNDFGSGVATMGRHIAEFADAIQVFDRIEEKASSSAEYFTVLEGLAPLHRSVGNLHQVLQEARKMVPEDRNLINFRDQSYDLERTADLLYASAKNGLEFAIARRGEEEAASSKKMAIASHRLNVLVAFFFPLATLSGVFGVNFQSGLEGLQPPLPLALMVAIGLATGAALAFAVTRSNE
jgi:hypothetical protein